MWLIKVISIEVWLGREFFSACLGSLSSKKPSFWTKLWKGIPGEGNSIRHETETEDIEPILRSANWSVWLKHGFSDEMVEVQSKMTRV